MRVIRQDEDIKDAVYSALNVINSAACPLVTAQLCGRRRDEFYELFVTVYGSNDLHYRVWGDSERLTRSNPISRIQMGEYRIASNELPEELCRRTQRCIDLVIARCEEFGFAISFEEPSLRDDLRYFRI